MGVRSHLLLTPGEGPISMILVIPHSKSPMVILGFIAFILPSTLDPIHFVKEKLNVERSEATHNHSVDRIVRRSLVALLEGAEL